MEDSTEQISAFNQRYVRSHIKPNVKSVYSHRKTVRLNGSLNSGFDSSGLNIMNAEAKNLTSIAL